MNMPKGKDLDTLYPNDSDKILTTEKFHTVKEEKPKPKKKPVDNKTIIKGLLEGAINLLHRNIRNKDRAIKKIIECIKLLEEI
jgi:hypothetical protein